MNDSAAKPRARRGVWLGLALVAAFAGYLLWSTLSAQNVECRQCVEFKGTQNCATASAANEEEAKRAAQATACGVLTFGMDESIACSNRPPVTSFCRTR
jgi:hypothetical protein